MWSASPAVPVKLVALGAFVCINCFHTEKGGEIREKSRGEDSLCLTLWSGADVQRRGACPPSPAAPCPLLVEPPLAPQVHHLRVLDRHMDKLADEPCVYLKIQNFN